ncbi:MAG: D-lyxose/D-mannose family sugar isomerase, partial [Bacteroidetes bacterium]|nr:D-lyxose/D-mannose family sugar isomerase [Bacteroidota bacterium]
MESEALIFIPDISGYTKFITETETKHSKHIIVELLEVIIGANNLGMQISEIEGDAVLYYRKGDPPKIDELILQAKKMFLAFHTQIKIIQRDNVCQCGACRTAINLTLKFVSHYGMLEEVTIQNFMKIMGRDVILTHRLLKNTINSNEYLLITNDYLNTQDIVNFRFESWISFKKHIENFTNFKDVKVQYILLEEAKKELPDVSRLMKSRFDYTTPDSSMFIDAPLLVVHELLTDHDAKLNYVPGLNEIKDKSPVNRVNTSHTCVFDDLEIHFVTISNEVKEKEISYVEEGEASVGIAFISDYKLKEEGNGTRLTFKIFSGKLTGNYSYFKKLFSKIMSKVVLFKLRKTSIKSQQLFKTYCEKILIIGEQQITPMHFHWYKQEDIINRCGGNLQIKLYNKKKDHTFDDTEIEVTLDG